MIRGDIEFSRERCVPLIKMAIKREGKASSETILQGTKRYHEDQGSLANAAAVTQGHPARKTNWEKSEKFGQLTSAYKGIYFTK